jgi:hypothetical protein
LRVSRRRCSDRVRVWVAPAARKGLAAVALPETEARMVPRLVAATPAVARRPGTVPRPPTEARRTSPVPTVAGSLAGP